MTNTKKEYETYEWAVSPLFGYNYCMCGCGGFVPLKNEWGYEAGYIRGHNPTSTRFKKGHVPWNKK